MAHKKNIKNLKYLLTLRGWRQILKALTKKERVVFSVFLVLLIVSGAFLSINFYFKNTEVKPAVGGKYTEGVIGGPRFINPVYGPESDCDRDLVELIYSGLMKYNLAGKVVPDLAKDYKVLENGKIYEVYLKENLFWSDSKPLTADDVIFTIKTIQNPSINSPLRAKWLGVKVEKISNLGISFQLKNSYGGFIENLTLKIMPKHIWENIPAQNFHLSIYNLKPVGSGPYKLKNIIQDQNGITSIDLERNPYYCGKSPYLTEVSFKFFEKEKDLIEAYQKQEIDGAALEPNQALSLSQSSNLYSFSLPRYFAVFFNPTESKIFQEKDLRIALNYGTDKKEIVDKILSGRGKIVHSPILPEIYGFHQPKFFYEFNLDKAKKILDKIGFIENGKQKRVKTIEKKPPFQFSEDLKLGSQGKEVKELQKCLANKYPEIYPEKEITGFFGNKTKQAVIKFQENYKKEILQPYKLERGTGQVRQSTRAKLNEVCFEKPKKYFPLKFSLTTVNQPLLIKVANLLKAQWEKLGATVEIKTSDNLEREVIKPRNYESLLFGEALSLIPDPFPFWHSSQKKDPGLNLAVYKNQECDKLLEETRESSDAKIRKENLEKFQDILIKDAPAVFLYNPDYLYLVSKEIKGITPGIIADPSKRFSELENWYIKTKRVWR